MLSPNKHMRLDKSVIAVSAIAIAHLRDKRVLEFEDLRRRCLSKLDGADDLFLASVNLLYLLGLLAYHPKTDSFEYTGK
jgi:hypothetical protein